MYMRAFGMKPPVVSLEGNIGSGKSTLLERVRHLLAADDAKIDATEGSSATFLRGPVAVLQEPVAEWSAAQSLLGGDSMLQRFYADPPANAFAFQMYVLATRMEQAATAPERGGFRAILTERCMVSDHALFAGPLFDRGGMTPCEWIAYQAWSTGVQRVLSRHGIPAAGSPTSVVYIRTTPDVCAARIGTRARVGESTVDLPYLAGLHEAHERWIVGLQCPVLTLDGDVDGVDAIEAHARAVVGFVNRQCALPV
jgi:deoxyadenosine/deoxycytidine kinase